MPDYQKLYHILFNEITDALDELERGDEKTAARRLRCAQRKTEELYIESEPSVKKLAKLIRVEVKKQ